MKFVSSIFVLILQFLNNELVAKYVISENYYSFIILFFANFNNIKK